MLQWIEYPLSFESTLIVTKSNEWSGKRTFGGHSLHCIDDPRSTNPYESVIDTIGRTLRDFGTKYAYLVFQLITLVVADALLLLQTKTM